jgi:hypothetical protein
MQRVKYLLGMLIVALILSGAKKPDNVRYDIECAGNGSQGTYLVKVWVYTKTGNVSAETLKRYAVHGVIFKGYAGKTDCVSQRPLANSPGIEQQQADFFNAFFNTDKAYAKYATEVAGSIERIKVGKEYKHGAVVSVAKDILRQDLEKAGIIRGLNSGF